MIPEDCRYTNEHEWVRMEDRVATVGITDFAQEQLGDVVYVDLPAAGTSAQQNVPFGSIDSVKTASDLYSPLSGEITEVNGAVQDDPGIVNSDPYGEGWMIRIAPADPSQLDALMTPAEYAQYIEGM